MACMCRDKTEEGGVDRQVSLYLKKERKLEKSKMKLLLLGAGESGKSTIFKQMKILYGTPATDEDRQKYTEVIYSNVMLTIRMILEQLELWGELQQIQNSGAVETVKRAGEDVVIGPDLGGAIKELWEDPQIQKAWSRRTEFQVVDSMKYFFEKIETIMDETYLATPEDYLYTRVRTSGVVTDLYEIEGVKFELYDVGGQRNERRKWIHCFSEVTAVIFVAALSEYDQVIFEDSSTNRMQEALDLFEEVCALKYFAQSSIILFLNKRDLFAEKIKTHPINDCSDWSDYIGGDDEKVAAKYFEDLFLARNTNSERMIYTHVTTATDTSNIKFVFNSCKDIILGINIDNDGF